MLTEIGELSNSNQAYDVFYDSSNNTDEYVRSGVVYDFDNDNFNIMLSDNTSYMLAHELKHAYQFEIGEFSSGYRGYPYYDITDEFAAYKRGAIYGGPHFSEKEIITMYPSLEYINKSYKNNIPACVYIERAKKHNYPVSFRQNGQTYVNKKH